jgi:hypothetical protein
MTDQQKERIGQLAEEFSALQESFTALRRSLASFSTELPEKEAAELKMATRGVGLALLDLTMSFTELVISAE